MSTDNYGRRACDGCGCFLKKAHRIHKGAEYCGTCYKRQFLQGTCPKCGSAAIYHKSEQKVPPCGPCERSERRCSRCDKFAPRARLAKVRTTAPDSGELVFRTVVACPSCFPYFSEEKPCGICGKLSQRLAGSRHLAEGVKACSSCVNAATHATCSRCRKHRKVAMVEDGKPMCRGCSGGVPAEHACPDCGKAVSGAGESRCDACVIRSRLQREVELQAAALDRPWVAALYRDFGEWSFSRGVPTPVLPTAVAKAAPFFRALDADPYVRQPIISEDMVRIFSSKTLRANLNATRYLCERYGFQIDRAARAEARDRALIAKRLHDCSGKPWGTRLVRFSQWLDGKPTRTISQYLGVAQAFCEHIELDQSFSQAHLVSFLEKVPGARATIGVWVSFVRAEYDWSVTMPPRRPARVRIRRDAERLAELFEGMKEPSQAADEDLALIISLLYQFDRFELRAHIVGVTEAGNLLTRNGPVEVRSEMKSIVSEWGRRNL